MSQRSKWEYFKAIYERYHRVPQALKRIILDELCHVCGYNRKYAIRKLNTSLLDSPTKAHRRKRPYTYSSQVIRVLSAILEAAGFPCSVRLKAILSQWLPWIQNAPYRILSRPKKVSLASRLPPLAAWGSQ